MAECLLVSDGVESGHAVELDAIAPGLERLVLEPGVEPPDAARVTLAYFSGDLFPEHTREFWKALLQAQGVRWLHSFSTGIDHPIFQRFRDQGAQLTTSSGVSAVAIAQTVTLYLLALSRDLRGFTEDQRAHRWQSRSIEDLQERTLLVLGLGPIGLEVARMGAALGMHVSGVRRRPRGDEPCETHPFERLPELLPKADWVVLALPLTPETRHVIDAGALAQMRPGARLINVGRGELVDEPALVRALESGHLGGAGLDVFETEPLPDTSPLWDLKNVIVTPHSAGTNPGNHARATAIFLENLGRYVRGQTLLNLAP